MDQTKLYYCSMCGKISDYGPNVIIVGLIDVQNRRTLGILCCSRTCESALQHSGEIACTDITSLNDSSIHYCVTIPKRKQ